MGQWDTAAKDTDESDLGTLLIALGNFVSNPDESPVEGGGVENEG